MSTITAIGSAASLAGLIVALFKFGFPSLPSYGVMGISLCAGMGSSFLMSLANGDALTTQQAAQSVVLGFFAAATAAGISRADRSADEKRTVVQNQEGVK